MPIKIDYAGLQQAMTHRDPYGELLYYLDTQTGAVLIIDNWTEEQARQLSDPDQAESPEIRLAWHILWYDGEPIGEELSETEEEAMYERVEAFLDRYAAVPTIDSRESYQDMVDFAGAVADPHLRDLLHVALQGKGAFRRFKDVLLSYLDERERWFEFRDQRLEERIDDWLRLHDLLPAKEEESEGQAARSQPRSGSGVASPATRETSSLTILNFAHPLTPAQLQQIKDQTGETIGQVIDLPVQLDNEKPFEPQIRRQIETIDRPGHTWQSGGILVNPPGYAPATAVLLAELHGRMGHFPAIIRVRPVPGSNPTRYEVAEIINLQAVRHRARERRQTTEV